MRIPAIYVFLLFSVAAPVTVKAAAMQISNLSDINIGSWGLNDPAVNQSMDMCVYSALNSPSGSYAITVTSSTGAFNLKNGTRQIPYSLFWDDSGAGSLGSHATQLTYGTKLASLSNANTLSPLCVAGVIGNNARLTIKIAATDLTAALAGTYSGTITILLQAN